MTITRERLRALFGIDEPRLSLVAGTVEDHGSYVLEHLTFQSDRGDRIRGFLTRPPFQGPHPAILYAHSHGGKYEIGADEMMRGRIYLLSALGPAFAEAGYVTLVIDMPTFGERAEQQKEWPYSKALLWYGKSLFGQMLSENAAALTWLRAREDVDADRVGMFGISMGAMASCWLAAVDERIAAIAHLCCYADFATLIEMGNHNIHGIYLTIPGLLAETSTGEIAGLVAPRPQLICVGDADALTPPTAVDRALLATRTAYGSGPLEVLREPRTEHQETQRMRDAVFRFFAEHLRR
jgi:dienelactone hydrolase